GERARESIGVPKKRNTLQGKRGCRQSGITSVVQPFEKHCGRAPLHKANGKERARDISFSTQGHACADRRRRPFACEHGARGITWRTQWIDIGRKGGITGICKYGGRRR